MRELTGREPLAFLSGPERVRTIGIVSGAGSDYLAEAIAAGHDAFLTGEPAERVMTQAAEDAHPLPRRRATTRPRRSASAGSASCSPSASGSGTSSSTLRKPHLKDLIEPVHRGWYKTEVL